MQKTANGLRFSATAKTFFLAMKMTFFLIIMAVCAARATGVAQRITVTGKKLTLPQIFAIVEKQTGYVAIANDNVFAETIPVSPKAVDMSLNTFLDLVLANQHIGYVIQGKTIFLSRKAPAPAIVGALIPFGGLAAPKSVRGMVMDSLARPLAGATVQIKGKTKGTYTNSEGVFTLEALETDVLVVSFIGFQQKEVKVSELQFGVWLTAMPASMGEVAVVSTGYQQLPRERATGSFTHINREMLNRSAGPDILSRLEGITNGLLFNRTAAEGENVGDFQLESRGRATIMSESSPLIVVDNFPFEGNIRDINPNDVESVTILKDAAAASIWGARAGNGVIVITTRQGNYNRRTEVSVLVNTSVMPRPDLMYDRQFMTSDLVMKIQKEKFLRGDYLVDETAFQSFAPYVELLIKQRDNKISEEEFLKQEQLLKNTDIRKDALKYLYRNTVTQQYSVNINGGSNVNKYYFSVGYDQGKSNMVGNDNRRLTINIENAFKPAKTFEINTRLGYSRSNANNNAVNITSLGQGNAGLQPYTRLADENGSPLPIEKNIRSSIAEDAANRGLLPWDYIPLSEMKLYDNTTASSMLNLMGSLRYKITEGLNIDATYQYTESKTWGRNYYSPETYYVRNLVNNYTQPDGTKPIPYGGILKLPSPTQSVQHSGRLQLNASKSIGLHMLAFLGGAEVRQSVVQSLPEVIWYNYDEMLGVGTAKMDFVKQYKMYSSFYSAAIPGPDERTYHRTNRYLSYFGNGSYTYKNRYVLSGSARWDGSNLFGVKTNQRGTLLWSAGSSWNISSEDFFKVKWMDQLRLRATYGSSGNVNKEVSTFPVIDYSASAFRNPNLEKYAEISSPGNPSLRWEKVSTLNFGVDWSVLNRRVSGSLEFFTKTSTDLIGDAFLPPSTGINSSNMRIPAYRYNYASMFTKGIDLQITSKNMEGRFNWQTTWLFNYAKDKITNYYNEPTSRGAVYLGSQRPLDIGRPISAIYALPWYGLDPANGKVLAFINGQKTTDYASYMASVKPGDAIFAGVATPPYYGSVLNNFDWKRFQLSVLLTWKAGYLFRRTSIFPGQEYSMNGTYHADLANKWQKPGDELITNVPKGGDINGYDYNEASLYSSSMALLSKGDHVAIQDINLSYTLMPGTNTKQVFKSMRLYTYIRNIGFLWKADHSSVDPNMPNARYPQQVQYNLGVQVSF